jgi:hypothetical protein
MAIVQFQARTRQEPDVWQCRCGCYTFWLYSNGSANCSECREEAVTMNGYWQIPEKRDSVSTGSIVRLRADSPESDKPDCG